MTRKSTKRTIHRAGIKCAPMQGDWRHVVGFDGLYLVNSSGNVFSLRSGRILKPGSQTNGYMFVWLYQTDWRKNKSYRIHRIVADAFVPNDSNLPEVNHKNGIKTDNRAENLEWVTRSQNNIHMFRSLGVVPYKRDGALNGNAKSVCSFSDADETMPIRTFGSVSEAAKHSGVFRTAISQALKTGCRSAGFFWRYV